MLELPFIPNREPLAAATWRDVVTDDGLPISYRLCTGEGFEPRAVTDSGDRVTLLPIIAVDMGPPPTAAGYYVGWISENGRSGMVYTATVAREPAAMRAAQQLAEMDAEIMAAQLGPHDPYDEGRPPMPSVQLTLF